MPMVDHGQGTRSTPRDYGCALVAAVAGVMFVSSVIGGTFALVGSGLSVGLIVGVGFAALFWFWIAVGAWRRTVWSSPPTGAAGPDGT